MTVAKIVNELTRTHLNALRRGEICAIVLDHLIDAAACARVALAVRTLTEQSRYRWSDDLTIIGVSIGEANETEEACERYLDQGAYTGKLVRDVVFGGLTPVDRVTLQMLQVWPAGIRIPAHEDRPFLQQVIRRWKQGGSANPHIDKSHTPLLAPFGISKRFGLNVYLEMPSEGGAVEFWSRSFTEIEYDRVRLPSPSYGLARELLGPPDLKIRPTPGQAILFDASRPHAVEPLSGSGERITCASFYGYAADDLPLYQFA